MSDNNIYESEINTLKKRLHELEENVNDLKVSYNYSQLKASLDVYDMLSQIQQIDKMILKKALKNEWFGKIENYGDFMTKIKSFDLFDKKVEDLREKAMRLILVERAIKETNSFIKENRELLPKANYLMESPELFNLAHEYLKKAPLFDTFDKKTYRSALIFQAMCDLSEENIEKAINAHVIRKGDIEGFSNAISGGSDKIKEQYHKNYIVISKALLGNTEEKSTDTIKTRIVGVTYANDDGTRRQDLLKDLQNKEFPINIAVKRGKYKDKPALGVFFDGKQIGFLPQQVADDIFSVYPKNTLSCEITEITGGFLQKTKDGQEEVSTLGAKVDLHISLDKTVENTLTNEKDKAIEEEKVDEIPFQR